MVNHDVVLVIIFIYRVNFCNVWMIQLGQDFYFFPNQSLQSVVHVILSVYLSSLLLLCLFVNDRPNLTLVTSGDHFSQYLIIEVKLANAEFVIYPEECRPGVHLFIYFKQSR